MAREAKGRPPKGPKAGKTATLATRITAETRAAIEAEAERTGRSISQVTEIWLDEARKGRAAVDQLLGGPMVASAVRRLIEVAQALQTAAPDLEFKERALAAAWRAELLFMPLRSAPTASYIAMAEGAAEVIIAIEDLISWIKQLPPGDRLRERAEADFSKNALFGPRRAGTAFTGWLEPLDGPRTALDELDRAVHSLDALAKIASILDWLLERSDTAPLPIQRCVDALVEWMPTYDAVREAELTAERVGLTIARALHPRPPLSEQKA